NAVAEGSYRGGRPGEQVMSVDGLEVRNWYNGSTQPSVLHVPIGLVEELVLVTDAAHLDGSPAGALETLTGNGSADWAGTARYDTDRPLSGAADQGLDRLVVRGGGPLGGRARVVATLDATGRLQFDPHNAPLGN